MDINSREYYNMNRSKGIYDYKFKNGCVNCGAEASQLHHIVPLVLGGTNKDSNIIALCSECHSKVHGLKMLKSHSKLVREGKKKAKKNNPNWSEGRPKVYTKEQLDHALSMLTINGGKYSYKEVEKLLNISKSTLIRENNKRKAVKEQ